MRAMRPQAFAVETAQQNEAVMLERSM
jgi:hypothetical protein